MATQPLCLINKLHEPADKTSDRIVPSIQNLTCLNLSHVFVLLSKKFSDVGLPPMTSNAESAFPVLAGNDTVLSVPPDSSLFSIRRSLHCGCCAVCPGFRLHGHSRGVFRGDHGDQVWRSHRHCSTTQSMSSWKSLETLSKSNVFNVLGKQPSLRPSPGSKSSARSATETSAF